jgi:hypothetical protein
MKTRSVAVSEEVYNQIEAFSILNGVSTRRALELLLENTAGAQLERQVQNLSGLLDRVVPHVQSATFEVLATKDSAGALVFDVLAGVRLGSIGG